MAWNGVHVVYAPRHVRRAAGAGASRFRRLLGRADEVIQ
jgi:hypothetical protein